jgi:hypothetical protein
LNSVHYESEAKGHGAYVDATGEVCEQDFGRALDAAKRVATAAKKPLERRRC